MAKISAKFLAKKSAEAAKAAMQKSLRAVGSSRVAAGVSGGRVEISVSDESAQRQKAAVFGARRLMGMLVQMDKCIK